MVTVAAIHFLLSLYTPHTSFMGICPGRRKGKAAKAVSTPWTLGLSLAAALPFRLKPVLSITHGRNEASKK
jgi:hypothetical protein